MKFEVKTIDITKSGEGTYGHWDMRKIAFPEAVEIFEQDGKKNTFTNATTFDSMASALQVGSTFEAEVEIKHNGKYTNLELKKIQTSPTQPTHQEEASPPPLKAGLPKPRLVDRDDIIAEQVAVKAVVELLCANIIDRKEPVAVKAMCWISNHLPGVTEQGAVRPAITSPSAETAETGGNAKAAAPAQNPATVPAFKTAQEFYQYALSHGETSLTFKEKTGCMFPANIVDLKAAIQAIYPGAV